MTVEWITTALDGPYSPITFTAAGLVAISARFVNARTGAALPAPEERVWRDGAFLYPYTHSRRSGTVWTVARDGGWPRHLATPDEVRVVLHVDEAGTGAHAFEAIYSVNFCSLPVQVLTAAGVYTIDGLTWYAKRNPGPLASVTIGPAGLTFENGSLGYPGEVGLDGDLTYRHYFCPLAQIAGYDPDAPLIIRFRSRNVAGNAYTGIACGLVSSTDDTSGLVAADRVYDRIASAYTPPGAIATSNWKAGATGYGGPSAAPDTGEYVDEIVRLYAGSTFFARATWDVDGGTFGDFSTSRPYAGLVTVADGPNPGIFVLPIGPGGVGNSAALTHLEILQPTVPL